MICEFTFDDIKEANSLLKDFNFQLSKDSFDNKFLNVLLYKNKNIYGILVYQNLIDIITIDYIVVSNEYRRKGIATKLLMELEKRHNNIKNITLEVRESNNSAIMFYEKNGFKKAAIRRHYYEDEDGILMIKELR